jgi:hypothetical protein
MVAAVTMPAEEGEPPTHEAALEKLLAGIERQRQDWKQSPTQKGTIAGQVFARAYWAGTSAEHGVKMRGLNYVMVEGRTILQVSSQDVEPHHTEALKLAEASVLTFRKAPPKP